MSSSHPPATSSNAIAIPRRKSKVHGAGNAGGSSGDSFQKYGSFSSGSPSSAPSSSPNASGRRRESLMSASFSQVEHTVINVGEEERPRLISCVKSGQGFDWNQEIFLPSYADYHFDNDLETRRDPVTDIIVTDEEIGKMFPE
ncbi:hypothetical protein HBI56_032500 [Parastagonospora nodorum]|nr:hypothetical protein HBH51_137940 [Parastagonospora nodorum]KAH4059199.1 hypothetical protein HBH49_015180 [Parastagonospora nodorum]KAH4177013.1 hypothetical protein HBH43_046750 [Parastagonospora nodorum]KAH4234422.1 hypothetical protein HBI05_150880 [Parastagonospora nodorum]KAH4241772.1 hypothetical protein HBI06_020660 [Parastagonospora nodorum]